MTIWNTLICQHWRIRGKHIYPKYSRGFQLDVLGVIVIVWEWKKTPHTTMRRRSWRFAAVTSHGETYSFLAFESERTERTQRGPQQRRPPISAPGTFLLPGFVSIESLTIFGAKSGAFDVTALSMYPNTLSPHFHTFRGVCTCIFFLFAKLLHWHQFGSARGKREAFDYIITH